MKAFVQVTPSPRSERQRIWVQKPTHPSHHKG